MTLSDRLREYIAAAELGVKMSVALAPVSEQRGPGIGDCSAAYFFGSIS
jgi:hypothetical protein